MIAARVFGNQTTVTWAGSEWPFGAECFMPVMVEAVLEFGTFNNKWNKIFSH